MISELIKCINFQSYFTLQLLESYFKYLTQTELIYIKFENPDSKILYKDHVSISQIETLIKNSKHVNIGDVVPMLNLYKTSFKNQIIEIRQIDNKWMDIIVCFPKDLKFLCQQKNGAYLIAILVKEMKSIFKTRNIQDSLDWEIAEIESEMMTTIFSKFLIYQMRKFGENVNNENADLRKQNWSSMKSSFNSFYRDIFHSLKTKKISFEDAEKNYTVLMDIRSTYKVFERC